MLKGVGNQRKLKKKEKEAKSKVSKRKWSPIRGCIMRTKKNKGRKEASGLTMKRF